MTSVNDRQVGGKHYRSAYQHWDWVYASLGGDYQLGCATKYIVRWREKNGLQDLLKAEHYLQKHASEGWQVSPSEWEIQETKRFLTHNPLPTEEGEILLSIVRGRWSEALLRLADLIGWARGQGYSDDGWCVFDSERRAVSPGFVWEGATVAYTEWQCGHCGHHLRSANIGLRVAAPSCKVCAEAKEAKVAGASPAYVNQGG